jgi:isoleucyl-tRNA synthetase
MFKEYRGNIDYDALEREILKFWDENSTFPRTLAQSKGKPTFAFYEGPPTANGTNRKRMQVKNTHTQLAKNQKPIPYLM